MTDYDLDFDEGIIIETEGVHRSGNGGNSYIKKMLLTNKNIIYVTSQKTGGMFSKSVDVVNKIPLSEVKVINGQVCVNQKKADLFEYALQIQFINGTEEYSYSEASKKTTNLWVNEMNRLLGNGQPIQNQKISKKKDFFGGLSDLASSVGTMAGTLSQSVSSAARQASNQAGITYENTKSQWGVDKQEQTHGVVQQVFAQQEQNQPRIPAKFCTNCGTKLAPNAKFCPGCGTAVSNSTSSAASPDTTSQTFDPSKRQQEYVGKIYKCPHCGEVVNQSDTVCSSCGYHLSGKQAMGSAMDFEQQLLRIEMTRRDKKIGFWDQKETLDATDKQMIALIKSYPIPNTIEDIVEFFHLAIGNIDVAKSKKSVFNTDGWDGGSREREISNAWVGKLQQIYKKAELYFPNEQEFAHIKEAYQNIMKKLKVS